VSILLTEENLLANVRGELTHDHCAGAAIGEDFAEERVARRAAKNVGAVNASP